MPVYRTPYMARRNGKKRLRAGIDKVLIVNDYRRTPAEQTPGVWATFEGHFLLNGKRYVGTHPLLTTVRLRLSDGQTLWGYECDWVAKYPRGPLCRNETNPPCEFLHGHEAEHPCGRRA